MRKNSVVLVTLALALLAVVVISCAAPTAPAPAPTAAPITVRETVIVAGTPQVVEKVITATPPPAAPTTAPQRPNLVRFNLGLGDTPTVDPNVAEDTSSITVIENSFVGLTRLDEVTSALGPGMATKWDISSDGTVYTFHLRTDVPWVEYDGTKVVKVQTCPDADGKTADRMVTAKDFEYGILRALAPQTASPYAYVLDFVIAGADDYNSGVITDTTKVGVKALDDATLQMTFKAPAAYNGNIAGLWTAYATPQWVIEGDDCNEARAERWIEPGFFQSYGPFTLKTWVHDTSMDLIKNPYWPGQDNVPQAKLDEVHLTMLDAPAALAEFESGNLDAMRDTPQGDLDRIRADPVLSKELKISPSTCTYFYGFNTKAPFVSNVNLRRALSYSVDRQKLIDTVLKGGQEPAQWFGRPGIAAAPTMQDSPDLGVKFDVQKAKDYLATALKELNTTADKLDLTLMFNTNAGHQAIAEFVQQQWKENLGVNVKLTNQEWKVYLVTTKSENTPQIWRLGWCMDYPDENNFINEVFSVNGSSNPAKDGVPYGGVNWKDDKFQTLVKQAAVEQDPAKRLDLYKQAEEILNVDDAVMIPLYWYTSLNMTHPYVQRTFSVAGHEIFYHWSVTQ